jgi:phosphomannomutase
MHHYNIQFGTDGWRALLGSHINLATISLVAQAFMDTLPQITTGDSKAIIIGYDGRQDSDVFAQQFSRIAAANGWQPLLSDRIIPTPVVSFTAKARGARAGVMITASHNPAEYNLLQEHPSAVK